jgi:hypothetical protein
VGCLDCRKLFVFRAVVYFEDHDDWRYAHDFDLLGYVHYCELIVIVQILGLPGSGKTTLAEALASRINGVVWNADRVRDNLHVDLGFSTADRVEHARRMGWAALELSNQNVTVIADFICPTGRTREAFGQPDVLIWVDRITAGRFVDTNYLWEEPESYDVRIPAGMTVDEEVQLVLDSTALVDWTAPHALMLGRFQPWHEGHEALWAEAETRTGRVAVGVRSMPTSSKDPLAYDDVISRIPHMTVRMPNITHVVYGRDVGYAVEQIHLAPEIEAVSATAKRRELGLDGSACETCPPGGCKGL